MVKKPTRWLLKDNTKSNIIGVEEYVGNTFGTVLAIFTLKDKNGIKTLARRRMRKDIKEDFAYGNNSDRAKYLRAINKNLVDRFGVSNEITDVRLYEHKAENDVYRQQVQSRIQTEARSEVEKALVQREAQVLYDIRNTRIDIIQALAKRLKGYIKDDKLDDKIDNKEVLDLLKQINLELGNNTDNIKVSLADGSLRDKLRTLWIE